MVAGPIIKFFFPLWADQKVDARGPFWEKTRKKTALENFYTLNITISDNSFSSSSRWRRFRRNRSDATFSELPKKVSERDEIGAVAIGSKFRSTSIIWGKIEVGKKCNLEKWTYFFQGFSRSIYPPYSKI